MLDTIRERRGSVNTLGPARVDGYEPVTTHIFDSVDEYLESDTVFAVKDSLICAFERHETRDEDATRFGIEPPFCTAQFDFVLKTR